MSPCFLLCGSQSGLIHYGLFFFFTDPSTKDTRTRIERFRNAQSMGPQHCIISEVCQAAGNAI